MYRYLLHCFTLKYSAKGRTKKRIFIWSHVIQCTKLDLTGEWPYCANRLWLLLWNRHRKCNVFVTEVSGAFYQWCEAVSLIYTNYINCSSSNYNVQYLSLMSPAANTTKIRSTQQDVDIYWTISSMDELEEETIESCEKKPTSLCEPAHFQHIFKINNAFCPTVRWESIMKS